MEEGQHPQHQAEYTQCEQNAEENARGSQNKSKGARPVLAAKEKGEKYFR
jgi:hypothetical protein